MNEVQKKIVGITENYMRLFPEEMLDFKKGVRDKQKDLTHRLGKLGKGDDMIERILLEYPETLYNLFMAKLTPEEITYFQSKRCARWYAKTYKDFRVAEKI